MKILITGGAGFVGANLATSFKAKMPSATVVAFDNLKRRGSELNPSRLKKLGIEFVHGDIRNPADLDALAGNFDLLIECSAEPSVTAGLTGSPRYLLETNLVGTLHCLEFARHRVAGTIFLSTSRVYSIAPLKEIALVEAKTRFELAGEQTITGLSALGIAETFPTHRPRSLYGASKLSSEFIFQEYMDTYGMKGVINRCGVLFGPGQFGKVDQGVFTLWVANHYYGRSLSYTGFGGSGKQVRDLLHPGDLFSLILLQIEKMDFISGRTFNVGGGPANSSSLLELTSLCREMVGRSVDLQSVPMTTSVDIPYFVTDSSEVKRTLEWAPQRSVRDMVVDVVGWIRENDAMLAPLYC